MFAAALMAVVCGAVWAAPSTLTYPGAEADLPVSFEYPSDWRLMEERGVTESYHAVRLLGPRNADDTYTAYFVVRAFPVQPPGSRYADQRALVSHILTHLPDGASVDPQATRPLDGASADEWTVEYTIPPLHHVGRKAVKIPVKTRTVVVQRGPLLYEIAYSADERNYEAHLPAFEGLLSSLQFR